MGRLQPKVVHTEESRWFDFPLARAFEHTAHRRLLSVLSGWAAGALFLTTAFAGLTGTLETPLAIAGTAAFIAFASVPVLVNRFDALGAATIVLLVTGIAIVLVPAYYQGGLNSIYILWFIVIPLLSGLMLGPKVALASGILGAIAMTVLYTLASVGELPKTDKDPDELFSWLNIVLGIGFSSATGFVASRSLSTSSKKLLEATLSEKAQSEAVEESSAHQRAIVDAALDAIIEMDSSGQIVEFNPAAVKTFGYEREDVLGKPLSDQLVPEELRDDHTAGISRYLQSGQSRILGRKLTTEAMHADGSRIPVELVVQPINVHETHRFTAYLRDMTEQNETQQKLLEQSRQLDRSRRLESVGRLAGGISHDFNNLLTAINGYAELLLETEDLDPQTQDYIEQIIYAGDQAAQLTRQLLMMSRNEHIEGQVIDPNELIDKLMNMLERVLPESIELHRDLQPDTGRIETDPGQLEQVIINLVLNARDAMPNGGHLFVKSCSEDVDEARADVLDGIEPGEYVRIEVSDSGTGIASEIADQIFDPFFTTKPFGEGTGMGLATAYGTVRRSGGALWADNETESGSTFIALLPRTESTEQPPVSETTEIHPGNGETLLVIEDQASVRSLITQVLRGHGYRVIEAADGNEAISLFESAAETVEMVITDVIMPGISGPEAVKRLRELQPEIAVVFMSGYTDVRLDHRISREPGVAFLHKPIRLSQLCAVIRKQLDGPPEKRHPTP
ncbi:PAS domain S-box protein [Myxococcota bacterium]|nr:PAS domain S-box protein [Myxococcota bacterium]